MTTTVAAAIGLLAVLTLLAIYRQHVEKKRKRATTKRNGICATCGNLGSAEICQTCKGSGDHWQPRVPSDPS